MEPIYEIVAIWRSGNSFARDQEDTEEVLMEHRSLERAKENLKRLKEHYAFNQFLSSYSGYKQLSLEAQEAWFKRKTHEKWFVKKLAWRNIKTQNTVFRPVPGHEEDYERYYRSDNAQYSIMLRTDQGKEFQISVPYIDYFADLNKVFIRIRQPKLDEDMFFSG
jgi:hypothetical protein